MGRRKEKGKGDFKDGRHGKEDPKLDAYKEDGYNGGPKDEKVGAESTLLQRKMYRDLNNLNVIDIKADPNAELSYGAFPYVFIGSTNPVIDAKYPGLPNIGGNTIVQLQNNTTTSKLMNITDIACLVKELNYLYLVTDDDENVVQNDALCTEFTKSVEQAISFGFSTMLTQLAFTTNTYETDMYFPEQFKKYEAGGTDYELVPAAQYTAALYHYQAVLQDLVSPIASYIEVRSLEKELMRMSFRTEAPLITQLFGLLKKASLISNFNALGTAIINEYFDDNWYHQINALTKVPSRKTRGMTNPLLTMVATHRIPSLVISQGESSVVYDSDNLKTAKITLLNPENFEEVKKEYVLSELILNINKLLNPTYIIKYVRLMNNKQLSINQLNTISGYAEAIKLYIDQIQLIAAYFSTHMSDIRTFLDKLSSSGMVYWKKGISFYIGKIEQSDPCYNVVLSNVFKATFCGADTVKYDVDTKRWRAWAFWNKYEGIPEYDRMSGGSFLTFGLRNINKTGVDLTSSEGLIPILFTSGSTDTNLCVTRGGYFYSLSVGQLTSEQVASDYTLNRLNPIPGSDVSIRIPTVSLSDVSTTGNKRQAICSAIMQFLTTAFGIGRIYSTGSNIIASGVDPDYLAFIDVEVEDVSNDMIVFARNYAPFRVATPNGKRTVGFTL